MRIAVLAHALRVAGGLSVGRNLVSALVRVAPEHRYLFTISPGLGYEALLASSREVEISVCQHPQKRLRRLQYELKELPRRVSDFRPDVVLALGNRGLTHLSCPQAILLHHPYLIYPLRHYNHNVLGRIRALPSVLAQRWCLRRSLRATQVVFCQTEVARQRMQRAFRYPGRIAVCPNAVSQWTSASDSHSIPAPLVPLAGKLKLFNLTRYYPHKNLEILIPLFRRYGAELSNVVVIITIAAEQCSGAARFLRAVEKHGLQDRIVNVGPLEQRELAGFFHHCDAMLMPTLLESYSGAYLEAMHFGLPILTSDLDFAHAVCDDAAVYFDPWSHASIRDAILRLSSDCNLADHLVDRGRERLKTVQRSWDDVVREMLEQVRWMVRGGSIEQGRLAADREI